MTKYLIVFIHGGQHTSRCWQPTIDAVEALQAANLAVDTMALNLPGHGDEPGDLASLSIAQCVNSVVDKIESFSAHRIVLVGHSMAGITLPGVAAMLGAERIHRMVYVACCVPPQGQRVVDTLHLPMNLVAGFAARFTKVSKPLPNWFASWVFANGATEQQKAFVHSCLCSESPKVTVEPVDRSDYPSVPTTWILPLRDRAVKPSLQRQFMRNLGRVDEIVELDDCHNVMVTNPNAVANVLLSHL